jgi:hypothetical protein
LSNDDVIRRVSATFVPVAVNLYKVREADDAGGELFRSVQRQKDQYQGVWIVSPEGKVLAGIHDYQSVRDQEKLKLDTGEVRRRMAEELLAVADQAIDEFGPVAARSAQAVDLLPSRGRGVQGDGSVTLAVYVRQMLGGGRESAPPGTHDSRLWLWEGPLRADGPPVIDSFSLDADQWSSFAPPKSELGTAETEPGTTWEVPDAIAREFCRVLVPSSDQSAMPLPDDARRARLTATVESVDDGVARIRLTGDWEAVHLIEGDSNRPIAGAAVADGIATYDVRQKSVQSLLLIFRGTHGRPNDDNGQNPTGAVVEWRRAE